MPVYRQVEIPACRQAGDIKFQIMYYVYVLYSEKFNRYYTGFTENIERRLTEHNTDKTKSTRSYKPWKLIFSEECKTRLEARNREKYYKSGVGREKIKDFHIINTKDY
jgi:putative endonuclease